MNTSMTRLGRVVAALAIVVPRLAAQEPPGAEPAPDAASAPADDRFGWRRSELNVNGVFPQMAIMAPKTGSRTEAGIGALIPWADRLWAVGYVAHISGSGLGLYEIREDMAIRLHPESVTGTFANRMIHWGTRQAIIGPHVIDEHGTVRTIKELAAHRLTATARHLTDPENKVYFLTMEGLLFETDLHTLESKLLYDLIKELGIDGYKHFKGAHTAHGRLVVANNSYDEKEFLGEREAGRLAEWDGKTWTILEKNPFVEVSGRYSPTDPLYALGWDKRSAILRVLDRGEWSRYRLPKSSQTFDHQWCTEWMRIREASTERQLMDAFGLFYEMPLHRYAGKLWGVRPIASHLRVVPDFVHWRGLFVLGSDQGDSVVGQPQSGLWFGNIDDLWKMGKPTGWGGPWWNDPVEAGAVSDPYLMTGFDKKVLHLSHDSTEPVRFTVEVDFLGDGSWKTYQTIALSSKGYGFHVFPDGYSAHWVRVTVDRACTASVYFIYN